MLPLQVGMCEEVKQVTQQDSDALLAKLKQMEVSLKLHPDSCETKHSLNCLLILIHTIT